MKATPEDVLSALVDAVDSIVDRLEADSFPHKVAARDYVEQARRYLNELLKPTDEGPQQPKGKGE